VEKFFFGVFLFFGVKTVYHSDLGDFGEEIFEVKTPILVEKIGKFYFSDFLTKKVRCFSISAYYWSTKIGEMVTNGEIFSWA